MDMFNGLDEAFKGMDNVNKILENSALNTAMKSIAHLDNLNIDSLKYAHIPNFTFSTLDYANFKPTNFDFLTSVAIGTAMDKIKSFEFAEPINSISPFLNTIDLIKFNLADVDFLKTNEIQNLGEYLAKSIRYDIVENHTDEKEIEEALNLTNNIVTSVNQNLDRKVIYDFLDSILIRVFSEKNISNTKLVIYQLIIGLLTNYIYDLVKSEKSQDVSVVNQTIINNNFYGNSLIINEIAVGNDYISSTIKELKTNRIINSKTIISVPIGTGFKVIKKFNKWVYISVIVDGNYYNGFIKIDNLYKLVN